MRIQENTSVAFYKIGTYFGGVDKVLRFIGEVGTPHELSQQGRESFSAFSLSRDIRYTSRHPKKA